MSRAARASSAPSTRRSPRRRSSDAFSNLVELSEPLARAGEARQDIDLIWGATLTRFVSLATGRLGSQFLSVGRVQSPTLAIVVERELERRAHVAEALLGGVRRVRAPRRRVRRAPQGGQVLGGGRGAGRARRARPARASSSRSSRSATRASPRHRSTPPLSRAPRPRSGVSPARAMRIAEDLYMDGFISYPRTDNTVYPKSLPVRELLKSISQVPAFKEAAPLAERDEPRARRAARRRPPTTRRSTRRRRSTRACCPTTATARSTSSSCAASWRRSPTRRCPSPRAPTSRPASETYFVRGNVLVEPGFLAVYPYGRSKDEEIPKVEEGQQLALTARRAPPGPRRPPRRTRGSTRRRPSRRRASARAS